jgi:hypothetical protein
MRAFELLVEAEGGMWDRMLEKKSGKNIQFTDGTNTYDLLNVAVFPQDDRLKYEQDPNDPAQTVDVQIKKDTEDFARQQGAIVQKTIPGQKRNAAAMVVILGDQTKKLAFIKYFQFKKDRHPPLYWQTSVFAGDTGLKQTDTGKSATAKAAEIRISPYDIVDPGRLYDINSIPNIIAQKLKTRTDLPPALRSGLYALADDLLKNTTPTPVPNIEGYQDQVEVVFGESVQPIALANNNRVTGSYKDAEKNLLNPMGVSWSDFKQVSFGGFGEQIGDSYLHAGEVKLTVSSKGKKGANASLTGAMETIEKYPDEFGPGTAFSKKYKKLMPVFQILHQENAIPGVIKASVFLKIITQEEADYIQSIYGKGTGTVEELQNYPNLSTVYKAKMFMGQEVTNKKGVVRKSAQGVDPSNPKFQMGYHLLGNLAKLLKIKLNEDVALMTSFFKAVLNKSSMVQVYTSTKRNEKGIWFDNFKVIWPPTFSGNIVIESDHYTSNARPSKKVSFKFD